jgi:nucleoside-diphosphate-sugar epimerase
MRVLLTGASGFVGSAILRRLMTDGHEVVALSSRAASAPAAGGVRWRQADLTGIAEDDLTELVRREEVTTCIHAAWYTAHADYATSPANHAWVAASLKLERAFRAGGGERFVGLGTCIEYDLESSGGCLSETATPLRPATVYGRCKVETFERLSERSVASGTDFAWARLFFVYGPGDRASRLVPYLLERLKQGESAVARFGGLRRDYIHVDDLAGQLVRIAAGTVRGAINTGTGCAERLADIFRTAGELVARPDLIDASDAVDPAQGERIVADMSRFRALIGDPAVRPLRDGLAALIAEQPSRLHP